MPRARPLHLLARLERLELDRLRRDLAAADRRLADLAAERAALDHRVQADLDQGWQLPGGPGPLAAWLAAIRSRSRAIDAERAALDAERQRLAGAVRAQHAEVRRRELLAERAVAADRAAAAVRETKALAELAVLRHGRRDRPGSELRRQRDGEPVQPGGDLDLARQP